MSKEMGVGRAAAYLRLTKQRVSQICATWAVEAGLPTLGELRSARGRDRKAAIVAKLIQAKATRYGAMPEEIAALENGLAKSHRELYAKYSALRSACYRSGSVWELCYSDYLIFLTEHNMQGRRATRIDRSVAYRKDNLRTFSYGGAE